MIRVYRINTGSCGACDIEITTAVTTASDVEWAHSPQDADVLLLTGPITHASKAALLGVLHEVPDIPVMAIGQCSVDGYPFGKGGVQELDDVVVQLGMRLDGCPPSPEDIVTLIHSQKS